MQGLILDELEKYVDRELGPAGLKRVRALTGRGDSGYAFDRAYPDEEVHLIVRGVVEATGKAPEVVLEQFAEAMVPGLMSVYGFLINPRWSFLDFLANTESVIHKGVRLTTESSKPPEIQSRQTGPESVTITYRSRRRLCPVAKGIIRGAAAHYHVPISITEERCMHRGDPECVITVSADEL